MPPLRRIASTALAALSMTLVLAAIPSDAEPAIWHLSDRDSDIYIFGTVHILPPGVVWLTPAVEQAFESADTIWFEAPANAPSAQAEMLDLIQQLGLNPPERPLSAQLDPGARATLAEIAPQVGLPVAGLEPLRPWLAAVTLTAAYVQSRGYDPESGVEARLWPLAQERGKAIEYFETLEEQVHFFADLPPAVEVRMFEETLTEYSAASDELDRLVAAWEAGHPEEIDKLVNGEMRRVAPEVYDVVISRRNASWVRDIQELLAGSGTHFIAVGAGHLSGSEGVIERLRAQGIPVSGP